MNYLKVVLMLWTYNIAFDTSETAAVVRGSINPWDNKQKYCGELLTRAIEIVCVEMKIKRRPRDTVRQAVARHSKNVLLQKSCCDDECSLNFIKANCPVKRKRSNKKKKNKKNPSVVQSPINSKQKSITTITNTTALPFVTFLSPKMKNATVSTIATTTTSTSITPPSTTPPNTSHTSTTITTTTTTTEEPPLSLVDYEFYLGFPP